MANLKRTAKDDGGRWELDVESHFGSWDEPIHYERPALPDGTRGYGCVPCTATEAWGLSEETIRDLFQRFGERNAAGFAVFTSGRKLRDALQRAGHASSDGTAHEMVRAVLRDQTRPEGATWGDDRPIETSEGPRQAHIFRWREHLP